MVEDPAPATIDLHARGQYFFRITCPTPMHEYWNVSFILVHVDGPDPTVVFDSPFASEKGTAAESVSLIPIRFMINFYIKWGILLGGAVFLSALIFQNYLENLVAQSPEEILRNSPGGEIRIQGMVKGGTLRGKVEGGEAEFDLIDGKTSLPVLYQGPPPDNLRELKVLILIGTWNADTKIFMARDIGLVTNYGYVLGAYVIGLLPLFILLFMMTRKVSLLYAEIKDSKLYQPE